MKVVKFYHRDDAQKIDEFLDKNGKLYEIRFITDDEYATRIYYIPIKQEFTKILEIDSTKKIDNR